MNLDAFLKINSALNRKNPLSDDQIAHGVGCSAATVAVARQRLGSAYKTAFAIAKQVGCCPSLISKLRKGKTTVGLNLALCICDACLNLVSPQEISSHMATDAAGNGRRGKRKRKKRSMSSQ